LLFDLVMQRWRGGAQPAAAGFAGPAININIAEQPAG
jgi:hypothetical protein